MYFFSIPFWPILSWNHIMHMHLIRINENWYPVVLFKIATNVRDPHLGYEKKSILVSEKFSCHFLGWIACFQLYYHQANHDIIIFILIIIISKLFLFYALGIGKKNASVSSIIRKWFKEGMYYDRKFNTCRPGRVCEHYMQVGTQTILGVAVHRG